MIANVWGHMYGIVRRQTHPTMINYVQLCPTDPHALCHCPCADKAVVIKRVGNVRLNFDVSPISNSRIEITFIFATSGLKLVSFTIGSDRSFALADASPTLHVQCLHALVLIWLCHVASKLIPFYSILININDMTWRIMTSALRIHKKLPWWGWVKSRRRCSSEMTPISQSTQKWLFFSVPAWFQLIHTFGVLRTFLHVFANFFVIGVYWGHLGSCITYHHLSSLLKYVKSC